MDARLAVPRMVGDGVVSPEGWGPADTAGCSSARRARSPAYLEPACQLLACEEYRLPQSGSWIMPVTYAMPTHAVSHDGPWAIAQMDGTSPTA